MIQVRAFSRLHFGFLNPAVGEGSRLEVSSSRWFGGVGLMIAQPDLCLRVEPASSWSAEGPLADRALAFAQRFAEASCRDEKRDRLPPRHVRIECVTPAHAGLGSGSQLGLSVARALAASWGLRCDLATLARRTGRGLRSALGTHGFEHGGLLVEAGKRAPDELAPLVARQSFPEEWRVVVALPGGTAGLHGRGEVQAFARLTAEPTTVRRAETLCRLVLLGLLPALVERDVDAFGEALYELNARVGEAFAPMQGGVYASGRVAEVVAFVRSQNIRGVAQSSWGPAVFAVVADEEQAPRLAARLRQRFALEDAAVWVTAACNHGAKLATDEHG
ncbi:MAG TPA: beta-ribofuranosylaminobenzene 5'-phosphate synthase family protein [Gemmataceae bacterium]|nr:beta-ribofuranosylaminobenzene 5'-phosphate synthase family protein [Gemmataceae bacterium]